MVARAKSSRGAGARVGGGGNYFASAHTDLDFISSGCLTLDLALGGGWAESRVANIVGDKSSGKTLLAIEAAANFNIKYPKSPIRYREAEAAFDPAYAAALGMPIEKVEFGRPQTVEDMYEDLQAVIKGAKVPELYIVDSLDALSDAAEMARDFDQGTYGANKPKQLSELFRRLVRDIEKSRVTMMIISQVRSNISTVTFGRGTTRSGGRALDFYASQVLYLTSGAINKRTIKGVERPVSISVRGRVDKNKVSLPFREAGFTVLFGYGIDDVAASLDWLKAIKRLDAIGLSNSMTVADLTIMKREYTSDKYEPEIPAAEIREVVKKLWYEIETSFLPTRSKYGANT